MADFNLLNSAARVPMGVQPFQPVDAVGNMGAVYNLAGKMTTVQEQQRQQAQSAMDRQALQAVMQSGKHNMQTPEGWESALGELQGKVSPDTFTALSDHVAKFKTADATFKQHLMAQEGEKLKLLHSQEERTQPIIGSFLSDMDKSGDPKAFWSQNYPKLVETLAQANIPREALQKYLTPGLTPEVLRAYHAGSDYRKNVIADQLHQAQMKLLESREKVINDTKNEVYRGPDGATFYVNPVGKTIMREDPTTHELSPSSLPKDAVKVSGPGSGTAGKQGTGIIQQVEEAVDLSKHPAKPEELSQARQFLLTGKLPQFGSGSVAAANKIRIQQIAQNIAAESGMKPEQITQLQNKVGASKQALTRLIGQDAQIQVGEENIKNVLTLLEEEIKKAGGPDSPKVRSLLNKVRTEWMGDPAFVGINQAYMDMQEQTAKLYSGATGAGATPVSFLHLAEKSLPPNPSLAQILKMREILPRLFDARKRATEDIIDKTTNIASLPDKKDAEGKSGTPKQDADAAKIWAKEVDDEVKKYSAATDPAVKNRSWQDIKGLQRERLKNKALTFTPAGQGSKPGDVFMAKIGGKDVPLIFKGGVWSKKENWEPLNE